MKRTPPAGRPGFALLATLWLVVAIGVVGLQIGLRARDQRHILLTTMDAVTARAAAESGVAHARAMLDRALRRSRETSLRGDGTARLDPWRHLNRVVQDTSGRTAGAQWHVRVEDAGARLDLNRATPSELRRLLVALRIDANRANRIAQSIADWRDPDDAHRPQGAEKDWYEQMGRLVLPRNAPMQNVADVRYVRGMDRGTYERMAPYLSVHGTGRVNLMSAPRPVLLALPGIGEEAVRALERQRRQRPPSVSLGSLGEQLSPAAREELQVNLHRLEPRVSTETREVRVLSEGRVVGSPVRVLAEVLIVRTAGSSDVIRMEVSS